MKMLERIIAIKYLKWTSLMKELGEPGLLWGRSFNGSQGCIGFMIISISILCII